MSLEQTMYLKILQPYLEVGRNRYIFIKNYFPVYGLMKYVYIFVRKRQLWSPIIRDFLSQVKKKDIKSKVRL